MTIIQFLKELKATPRKWYLGAGGDIRFPVNNHKRNHCPLSKVAKTLPCQVYPSAKKMGLSRHSAERLWKAADVWPEGYDEKLRARLLKAVGL